MFHSFEASLILYFFSSVPRYCSNFLLDHTLLALFPPLLRATLLFQHFLRLVHWPINDCTFEIRQRERKTAPKGTIVELNLISLAVMTTLGPQFCNGLLSFWSIPAMWTLFSCFLIAHWYQAELKSHFSSNEKENGRWRLQHDYIYFF